MYYSASRVLAILDLLQTHGRMRGEELADRLSVDVRTVRRYVMILRDRGIPIDMKRGRYGGYALPTGYRAPLALSKQEALTLANGLLREDMEQSHVATNDGGRTLKKIAHLLPRATRDLIQHLERAVIVVPTSSADGASIDADHLETVVRAIYSCSRLRIRYRAWTGEESMRTIDPYKIVSRYGRWYLVGYCHLRSCQRVFRLDHLVGAAILPEMFQMPSIDALAVVEHAIAQTPWRWEYRVLVDMPLVELRQRIPRTMAVLEPQEHGVLMYGFAQDLDWLAYTLAGLQCSLVIVQPFELRAHFLALANHVRAIGEQTERRYELIKLKIRFRPTRSEIDAYSCPRISRTGPDADTMSVSRSITSLHHPPAVLQWLCTLSAVFRPPGPGRHSVNPNQSRNQRTELRLNLQTHSNLRALSGRSQVTALYLYDCHQLSDLSPLAGLTRLTELTLWGCGRRIRSGRLRALAGLPRLTIIR